MAGFFAGQFLGSPEKISEKIERTLMRKLVESLRGLRKLRVEGFVDKEYVAKLEALVAARRTG